MVQANDFILSEDEVEYISNLLNDEFDLNAILLVHIGMVVAPRLIKNNIIPGPDQNILDPDFLMQTIHVATAMRIFGLNKYGYFYFYMIDKWKLNNCEAINKIIVAIRIAYKDSGERSLSLWPSSIINTCKISDKVFSREPIFEKDKCINDEIDYYDKITKEIFLDDYMNKLGKKIVNVKLENFFNSIAGIIGKSLGENEPPDSSDDVENN